jgi:hypothetical protein
MFNGDFYIKLKVLNGKLKIDLDIIRVIYDGYNDWLLDYDRNEKD